MSDKQTQSQKSLPKSVECELGGKKYVVRKMHVGRYAALLGMLENLPEKLMELYPGQSFEDIKAKLSNMSIEDMIRCLPMLMQFAANEVLKIVAFASNIPVEVFEYREDMPEDEIVGLDEVLELVDIILQVNNFDKVAERIKNWMTLRQA